MINRSGLAQFLRRRRESLRPENVGLASGPGRRTNGLRREEVASICHLSVDYYSRLEQKRGPHPSQRLIASIAQGMRLSPDERDHLFHLAGYIPPAPTCTSEQITPGMLNIFERLADGPAEIVTELGETLRQSPLSIALTGDTGVFTGASRSIIYRWFTDPRSRLSFLPDDHERLSRYFASGARWLTTLRGPESRAAGLARRLLSESPEFTELWHRHDIDICFNGTKRLVHPEVGIIELHCEKIVDPERSHLLLVYTAVPGSPSQHKLQHLAQSVQRTAETVSSGAHISSAVPSPQTT